MIELVDGSRRFLDEAGHDVLIRQEVGPLDGIPGVQFETVALVRLQHGARAPFRADRVRTHELHFRHQCQADISTKRAGYFQCRAQAGKPGSQDDDIVTGLHAASISAQPVRGSCGNYRRPDLPRGARANFSWHELVSWLRITRTNNTRNETVGTAKKSAA